MMSSRRNLNEFERSRIIHLREEGLNISEIAGELKMSRNTVRKWIQRYDSEGHLKTQPRQVGQRRIITKDRLEKMVETYENQPFTPTRKFAKEFECSMQTVRDALKRAGMKHKNPPPKKNSKARNGRKTDGAWMKTKSRKNKGGSVVTRDDAKVDSDCCHDNDYDDASTETPAALRTLDVNSRNV